MPDTMTELDPAGDQAAISTFSYFEDLPPLPVPPLRETLARYVETVAPLLSPSELAKTGEAVAELLTPGGVADQLQAGLEIRGETRDNWLSGWWEEGAYLAWPDPLPINSSIAISCDARLPSGNQALRAAEVTHGAASFYTEIRDETFPPETQRDGSGLDMSLLRRFFATNRVPGPAGDRIESYQHIRHIVVLRNRRLYTFDVLDEDGAVLPVEDLNAQFQRIITARAPADNPAPAIAALTAVERPVWAEVREGLCGDPHNKMTLGVIESALFHVCVDDIDCSDFTQLGREGFHGRPGGRWFDKALTLVVDQAGRMVLHGEHSPVDAGAWCPLLDRIGESQVLAVERETTDEPAPKRLHITLDAKAFTAVDAATAAFNAQIDDLDLQVTNFDAFGKNLIKTFKTGPDPVIQMAMQLAYFRTYGRLPKTYESASTRMYKLGRTETIRVASNQALALVRAMDEPGVTLAERAELARAAFAEHSKRGREASAGFGVDRHLFGLAQIAKEQGIAELPALFSEEIYTRSWELSTAQVPLKSAFCNHFGPVMEDGYGVAYVVKPDELHFSVSSFRRSDVTDTAGFTAAIVQALQDMRSVLEAEAGA
ncbi:MAG: choline/carnitine O-acyltransferase [Pseudomonadota bacterium]